MNHIIQKQTLAIDLPVDHDAWDVQSSFKELFYGDVLPRLERVCDELGLDHRTRLRIDRLTIDAGSMKSQELPHLWAEEVESAFRKELLQYKKEHATIKDSGRLSGVEQSEFGAFLYFLENGVLPWWISDEFNTHPREMLKNLLAGQASKLATGITGLRNKKQVLKRLLLQFEPEQVHELLEHFDQPLINLSHRKFKELCLSGSESTDEHLERAFLATEIVMFIDPKVIGNNLEKYFKVLFDQIREHDPSSNQALLSKIHNTLNSNQKASERSKSIEGNKLVSAALNELRSLLAWHSESAQNYSPKAANQPDDKTVHTTQLKADHHSAQSEISKKQEGSLSSKATTSHIPDSFENKNLPEPHNRHEEENPNETSTREAAGLEKNETNSPEPQEINVPGSVEPESQLSALDKRAWEHIERIKKRQLEELKTTDKANNQSQDVEKDNLRSDKEQSAGIKKDPLQDDRNPGENISDSSPAHTGQQTHAHLGTEDIPDKHVDSQSDETQSTEEANLPSGQPGLAGNDQASVSNLHKKDIGSSKASRVFNDPSDFETLPDEHEAPAPHGLADSPDQALTSGDNVHTKGNEESTQTPQPQDPDITRKPDKSTLTYWQEEPETINECYIQNAGLILFWPYLGHFFKDLGLTTDGSFKTATEQHRAALTLQYLMDETPEFQEYKLPLNKLLCGLKINEPIGKTLALSQEELNQCNNLLKAAIQNWSALRGTSIAGFQSSFVRRSGVLKRHDKHWQLQVEKKPFDMLMEQLPWPIGIVRLSWMKKPIYVEW